jgi:hypothetical protein
MKHLFVFLLFTGLAYSQSVRTEAASNRYVSYSVATADSVAADTIASGVYLVGVVFNTVDSSDTLRIYDGSDTIATIIFDGTPPDYPIRVDYGLRVSGVLAVKRSENSDITVVYRIGF